MRKGVIYKEILRDIRAWTKEKKIHTTRDRLEKAAINIYSNWRKEYLMNDLFLDKYLQEYHQKLFWKEVMTNDNRKDPVEHEIVISQKFGIFKPKKQNNTYYDPLPGENAQEKSIYLYMLLGWSKKQIASALSISRPTLNRLLVKNKEAYSCRIRFTLPKLHNSLYLKYLHKKQP